VDRPQSRSDKPGNSHRAPRGIFIVCRARQKVLLSLVVCVCLLVDLVLCNALHQWQVASCGVLAPNGGANCLAAVHAHADRLFCVVFFVVVIVLYHSLWLVVVAIQARNV
jgi:hypothetical protein